MRKFSGRTIETIERSKTEEEIEELHRLRALRAEEKKQQELRESRDRVLLLTYQSIDEIVAARDTKLTTVETAIQHMQGSRKSHVDRLRSARQSAADYERASKPIPQGVLDQIQSINGQIAKIDQYIESKRREQDEIRQEFAVYIARYRELTHK